ncbi:hypothetical protein GA0070617_1299 [Micromonospora yangpuensis]|uniref:Uncharacterized protein n=2 Tax=Micromonospora yangpuensis TaxID=683228 RepID=A0A1C6U7D9_9ACTN|nr:hypothetical protein GA0070617_1299 [Micromonospora yangpuensis]
MIANIGGGSKPGHIDPATATRLAQLAGRRARLTMRHITGAGQQWRRIGQWPSDAADVSTLDIKVLTNTALAMEWGMERAEIGSHRGIDHMAIRPHRLIMPGRPPIYGDDPEKLAAIAERELRDELAVRSVAWHATYNPGSVARAVEIHRANRRKALT